MWEENSPVEIEKNNSTIVDAGHLAQGLTQEEIIRMKEDGTSAEDIIAALTANNATFVNKTEFSQEKYKRRKSKKYGVHVCVRRPTATSICEAMYVKHPGKIGGLRVDTLALMLSLANVGAYARVLIVETCGGLVTGAVAERLGGFGSITTAYLGDKPPSLPYIKTFNFPDQVEGIISRVALKELTEESKPLFDSCIVCSTGNSPSLLRHVLHLLEPSSQFAVYCSYLHPMTELHRYLKHAGSALHVDIKELFMREHQVAPSRTHPNVNMNHGGGYILSGTTIIPQERKEYAASNALNGDDCLLKRQCLDSD